MYYALFVERPKGKSLTPVFAKQKRASSTSHETRGKSTNETENLILLGYKETVLYDES